MHWFSKGLITEPSCSSLVWRGKLERPLQTLPLGLGTHQRQSASASWQGIWGRQPEPVGRGFDWDGTAIRKGLCSPPDLGPRPRVADRIKQHRRPLTPHEPPSPPPAE